jgi:serine/threonine protein kinase
VAHNDIKAHNMASSHRGFKLLDFDAAIQLEHQEATTNLKPGRVQHWPPEVCKNQPHAPLRSDCFALGKTFGELGLGWAQLGCAKASETEVTAMIDDYEFWSLF